MGQGLGTPWCKCSKSPLTSFSILGLGLLAILGSARAGLDLQLFIRINLSLSHRSPFLLEDPSASPACMEERVAYEASKLEKRLSLLSHGGSHGSGGNLSPSPSPSQEFALQLSHRTEVPCHSGSFRAQRRIRLCFRGQAGLVCAAFHTAGARFWVCKEDSLANFIKGSC